MGGRRARGRQVPRGLDPEGNPPARAGDARAAEGCAPERGVTVRAEVEALEHVQQLEEHLRTARTREGGQAFPIPAFEVEVGGEKVVCAPSPGLTVRDWLA